MSPSSDAEDLSSSVVCESSLCLLSLLLYILLNFLDDPPTKRSRQDEPLSFTEKLARIKLYAGKSAPTPTDTGFNPKEFVGKTTNTNKPPELAGNPEGKPTESEYKPTEYGSKPSVSEYKPTEHGSKPSVSEYKDEKFTSSSPHRPLTYTQRLRAMQASLPTLNPSSSPVPSSTSAFSSAQISCPTASSATPVLPEKSFSQRWQEIQHSSNAMATPPIATTSKPPIPHAPSTPIAPTPTEPDPLEYLSRGLASAHPGIRPRNLLTPWSLSRTNSMFITPSLRSALEHDKFDKFEDEDIPRYASLFYTILFLHDF
ncbi:MAG: hypothetical protein QOH50_5060 [Kribbellaceae bacterium]|nr:hypothetical protein [Kribbellaceae bacterium]